MGEFLLLAFLFLVAGVVAVPIASRLGLGSVLGYLIAGIVISPVLAGLGVDVMALQHFAEFGVVMMLFLVGLELEPKLLWQMKARLLGLGGLQVTLTTVAIMAAAMAMGITWTVAIATGLVLALSSTAIVLQTLNEKGLMKSDGGQSSFSILLFQDIAVIPMLALIPLLALPELAEALLHAGPSHGADAGGADHGPSMNLVEGLAGWKVTLITLAAIAAVAVIGNYLIRPIFRFIEVAQLRELFTAAALMIVIGIALLMTLVGLSPALGTFLAGVVLANSEYRHELESDIGPFKGLLLGLFFMTVGAGINFALLFDQLGLIVSLTLGLMLLKALIILALTFVFKIGGADRWLVTLGLAQAGEFGFVLLSFTVGAAVMPQPLADQLLLVVALSMLLTPVLFILYDRVIAPRFAVPLNTQADKIDHQAKVIIAGHGRFGGVINRMLLGAGYSTVVLDHATDQLEMLRTFGIKVFYGDATRPDLLDAAGIAEADMLVVAIDDQHKITELVRYATTTYPDLKVVARALNRHHVYELYAAGCREIIRDTFDSALRAGRSAYEALGMHPFEAEQKARGYAERDGAAMREMAGHYDPTIPTIENKPYIARARALMAEQEAEMKSGKFAFGSRIERGWTPPTPADIAAEEGET